MSVNSHEYFFIRKHTHTYMIITGEHVVIAKFSGAGFFFKINSISLEEANFFRKVNKQKRIFQDFSSW